MVRAILKTRKSLRLLGIALGVALCAVSTAAAIASTTTATATITGSLSNTCYFNSVGSPGTQSISAASVPPEISASISLTCTVSDAYNLELSPGSHGSDGATPTRNVANGSNLLGYQIYRNSGKSGPWGDTIGTNTVAQTGTGGTQTFTYYVDINQPSYTLPAGSYSDTVTVTVAY